MSWLLLLRSSELPRLPVGVLEFLSVRSSDTGTKLQSTLSRSHRLHGGVLSLFSHWFRAVRWRLYLQTGRDEAKEGQGGGEKDGNRRTDDYMGTQHTVRPRQTCTRYVHTTGTQQAHSLYSPSSSPSLSLTAVGLLLDGSRLAGWQAGDSWEETAWARRSWRYVSFCSPGGGAAVARRPRRRAACGARQEARGKPQGRPRATGRREVPPERGGFQ